MIKWSFNFIIFSTVALKSLICELGREKTKFRQMKIEILIFIIKCNYCNYIKKKYYWLGLMWRSQKDIWRSQKEIWRYQKDKWRSQKDIWISQKDIEIPIDIWRSQKDIWRSKKEELVYTILASIYSKMSLHLSFCALCWSLWGSLIS